MLYKSFRPYTLSHDEDDPAPQRLIKSGFNIDWLYATRSAMYADIDVGQWHKANIKFDAEHVRLRGQSGHL